MWAFIQWDETREQMTMKNAFFRLMARLFGQTKYMDEHLEGMAKYFGETAVIR